MERFKIVKIKSGIQEIVDDVAVEETPLTLVLDSKELVTILCMPEDLKDLVLGFLFTSGLIRQVGDVKDILIDTKKWAAYIDLINPDTAGDLIFKRMYTSGCGKGTLFYNVADIMHRAKIESDLKIEASKISSLMIDFQKKSEIFLKTGGTHGAALSDNNGILIFREDIGRHNAIDKVIGARLKEAEGFNNLMLITSGRISSEVLLKAQKCKIPIIVSKSAPTNQGVKLAHDMGIALIGFARGSRMNIYSNEERVIYDL